MKSTPRRKIGGDIKLKKIILSKKRSNSITTHKILKDYILLVREDEIEDYKKVDIGDNELLAYPNYIEGLGQLRNYCMDRFLKDNDAIVMFDDDIHRLISLAYSHIRKGYDKDDIEQLLYNTALNCKDAGAMLFGFGQKCDVRKFNHTNPIKLKGWVGGVVGIIKGNQCRFLEQNKMKVDIDFCLQNLLVYRKLYIDNRFFFDQKRDTNSGGNSEYRTKENLKKEIELLNKRRGKYISTGKGKQKNKTKITKVKRKQKISLDI